MTKGKVILLAIIAIAAWVLIGLPLVARDFAYIARWWRG